MSPDPLTLFTSPPLGGWPGLFIMSLVGVALYRIAIGSREMKR